MVKLEHLHLAGERSSSIRIIVGLDFGTTFSGLAWATTDRRDADIDIIHAWPGRKTGGRYKAPSRIAYAQENPNLSSNKWGFDVNTRHISYSWTKLLLDQSTPAGLHDDTALTSLMGKGFMNLPEFRDAAGVCEDLMGELYQCLCQRVRVVLGNALFDRTPMECWITLPAIWSEEAKHATLNAARNAGFGSRPNEEVFTISEPEAAAISTLKDLAKGGLINGLRNNENILICDCGGGTVDLTAYTVTEIEPRLQFDELCVGTGGKCGSTYIDRNLHKLLSKRYGAAFDAIKHSDKGPGSRLMADFEELKINFGREGDYEDLLLENLILEGVPASRHYDDLENIATISYEDMRGLFDPVVDEIKALIEEQLLEADRKSAGIDRIILAGGFAESPYLHRMLASWCEEKSLLLVCAKDPQVAVVRGAVLRGLEGLGPQVRQARLHYGTDVGMPFREGIDASTDRYLEPFSDSQFCRGRMDWLIGRGESVFKDAYRSRSVFRVFVPGQAIQLRFCLYSSKLDSGPERLDDAEVNRVGEIAVHIPADCDFGSATEMTFNRRLGKTVHRFWMQVQVIFGAKGENLKFKVMVNKKECGSAVIEFPKH